MCESWVSFLFGFIVFIVFIVLLITSPLIWYGYTVDISLLAATMGYTIRIYMEAYYERNPHHLVQEQ